MAYEAYKNLRSVSDVARWIIAEKVGSYGTTKTLLYQAAVEGVAGSLFNQRRVFQSTLQWAEYVSEKADKVVEYIIKNDKCIVPIYER